ncbi:MAG: DUF2147 domain-containing protein [Bacteroidota bacterium]
MSNLKFLLILFSIILSFTRGYSQIQADDLLGQYWTEGKEGKIEIYKEGDKFFGKILWRKEARKDSENPDTALRNRSVIGLVFLKDFSFEEEIWTGGSVYSIDNGNTYSGKLWLEDGGQKLKMRGYIGFSLLGRTASLERVSN